MEVPRTLSSRAAGSYGSPTSTAPPASVGQSAADALAARALAELEARSLEYWRVRRAVKEEIIKPRYAGVPDELAREVVHILEDKGLAQRLRNEAALLRQAWAHREASSAEAAAAAGQGSVQQAQEAAAAAGAGTAGAAGAATRAAAQQQGAEAAQPTGAQPQARPQHKAVAACRARWHKAVAERVNRLSREHGVPLAGHARGRAALLQRQQQRQQQLLARGDGSPPPPPFQYERETSLELTPAERLAAREGAEKDGSGDGGDGPLPLIADAAYSWADLLQALEELEPATSAASGGAAGPPPPPQWGSVRLRLRVPSLAELSERLAELSPAMAHAGVDDAWTAGPWFAEQRQAEADAVAANGSPGACHAFARRGVPQSARPRVWAAALGVLTGTTRDRERDTPHHFNQLCADAEAHPMMVDALVRADVAATADMSEYFVFEEPLCVVLLAFMRDASVAAAGGASAAAQPRLRGMDREGNARGLYPPCGVVPFHGLSHYAAPLCYLYSRVDDLFFAFRALYERHFCRLHTLVFDAAGAEASLSGPYEGLPQVCKLFEDMLQELDPECFYKLLSVGVAPLSIAMPWLVSAFVSYLEVSEVLALWDRVIGFDSLFPLSAMAAAVVRLRREAILQAQAADEVRAVFDDITTMRTASLLQSVFLT